MDRGRARWADSSKTQIIILQDTQARYELSLHSEMRKEEAYWRDVARQRGGEEVSAVWAPRMSNGYSTMQAKIVVDGRAQA